MHGPSGKHTPEPGTDLSQGLRESNQQQTSRPVPGVETSCRPSTPPRPASQNILSQLRSIKYQVSGISLPEDFVSDLLTVYIVVHSIFLSEINYVVFFNYKIWIGQNFFGNVVKYCSSCFSMSVLKWGKSLKLQHPLNLLTPSLVRQKATFLFFTFLLISMPKHEKNLKALKIQPFFFLQNVPNFILWLAVTIFWN